MTAEVVERWLAARVPQRPWSLEVQMSRSVSRCPAAPLEPLGTMAAALGFLGIDALRTVAASGSDSPDLALELLAADAFVTYAFEAAAEAGVPVAPLVAQLLAEAA